MNLEMLESLKSGSVLLKTLFLPLYLRKRTLEINVTNVTNVFKAEHFMFYLFICLQQENSYYSQHENFYRNMSTEQKV